MKIATGSVAEPKASRYRLSRLVLASFALSGLVAVSPARAASGDDAINDAQGSIGRATQGSGAIEQAIANSKGEERSPEARIADGELLLRSKDYDRAAGVFNQIIEKYPKHPTAFPDSLFLLGETYFESKQYLSARRVYRQIVERAGERGFVNYQSKALARLIDVALRIQDFAMIDDVFAKINQLPPASVEGELSYARGKGLYVKKDYAGAKAALGRVSPQSLHYHQAKYLLGVVAMKEAAPPAPPAGVTVKRTQEGAAGRTRYAAAVEAFRQVTQLSADTADHRHVIDLAWLAIGRLLYETDQWMQAADAYNHVERSSPSSARCSTSSRGSTFAWATPIERCGRSKFWRSPIPIALRWPTAPFCGPI